MAFAKRNHGICEAQPWHLRSVTMAFAKRNHGIYEAQTRHLCLQERDGQSGHDDAHHRHELDEDVKRRARGVLERVAHGVAHDCGLVVLAAFALEVA